MSLLLPVYQSISTPAMDGVILGIILITDTDTVIHIIMADGVVHGIMDGTIHGILDGMILGFMAVGMDIIPDTTADGMADVHIIMADGMAAVITAAVIIIIMVTELTIATDAKAILLAVAAVMLQEAVMLTQV